MTSWNPRFALAALALTGSVLCFAQTGPTPGAGSNVRADATHDCSGMTGTALSTCVELNRGIDATATGAGTPNDCSGMTGAPLDTCRRLNHAETTAPRSSAGRSDDCSGQVGDALAACRALNDLPNAPGTSATAPAVPAPQQ